MNVFFLVGNGFNYMIEEIIRKVSNHDLTPEQVMIKRETADSIRAITGLWKKFDDAFAEFYKQFEERGIRISHEELIRLIYTVINLFSSMSGFEKILPKSDIEKLNSVFDGFLLGKIREIAKEFQEHQDSEAYGHMRNYFPNFSNELEGMIRDKKLNKLTIFTTNYDGVLDTLTTKIPKGFMFSDGFATAAPYDGLLDIVPDFVWGNSLVLAHLHGSYRFTKAYGRTYKTRANIENEEPVMVFNNPNMKEEIVKNDNVLSEYYDYMAKCMETYDHFVILGNSMEAEPHIKKLLKLYSKRKDVSITVCSRNPNSISAEIAPFFKGKIYEETTRGVDTEADLISLFDKLTTF